jgi:thiol-disulfide isomerase/thioredoxin
MKIRTKYITNALTIFIQMKKVLGILIIILSISSCNNDKNVTIKGSYPAGSGQILSLEMLNIDQTQFIDSVKVSKSGKFQISFDLDNPELILVKNESDHYINLLAFPDDHIQVEIPQSEFSKGYSVRGSVESEKIKSLVDKVEETKLKLDSLSQAYEKLEDKEGPEGALLVSAYQQISQDQKRNNIRHVVENLNSLSSVYALYQRIGPETYILNELKDLQYFKIVADSIKVKYPGSTLTTSLVMDVDKRIQSYNNVLTLNSLAEKKIQETGLIELNIEDTDGNEVSLSSLKGKVVLINFWASWDNDSKEANNLLKGLYNKYHSRGFEVYSVGLENNRNNWRSTIDFEEYNWINVSELTHPYSYAATAYNVTEIPANYLIDREGTIVAKNINGNLLATWLDNLL